MEILLIVGHEVEFKAGHIALDNAIVQFLVPKLPDHEAHYFVLELEGAGLSICR